MTTTYLPPQIEVAGVPFDILREDGRFYLRHPRWSLVGRGRTLAEAEIDLFREAQAAKPVFLAIPPAQLDAEATKLVDFLLAWA